jgi:hypothetical protein
MIVLTDQEYNELFQEGVTIIHHLTLIRLKELTGRKKFTNEEIFYMVTEITSGMADEIFMFKIDNEEQNASGHKNLVDFENKPK